MFDVERREEILNILKKCESISIKKLPERLFVSPPTVRRDLRELEERGMVLRTHGGVVLRRTAEVEVPLMFREDQNGVSKKIIAEKAAKFIKDGDVIFLDASSTAACMVPYLKKFNDLIVITNSPKTSLKLGEESIKNYCTGACSLLIQ